MKKLLGISIICAGLLWIVCSVFFVSMDLEPEEQQKLKEGKLFWEWPSPYGPLAIHYKEKGEGSKHILLLHGFRANAFTWRYLIEPLAQAGYHVWVIDLIGYGLSDKPDHAPYDINFFVQQVVAFLEAKGISQAHLAGNSMGGGLSLKIALDYPERIHSLVLLSPLGYPVDLPLSLSIERYFGQLWGPFLGPTIVRYALKQIVFNQDSISAEQIEAYCLPYRFPGGTRASLMTLRQFDNQHLIDMGLLYPTLLHPLLIIWGDQDTLIPVSHYEQFLKDFPKASGLLIADCGHIPQEEEPQQVLTAMLNFLHKVEGIKTPLSPE
jgi:pimeloyl-ACP methyl ester carboxylesterase